LFSGHFWNRQGIQTPSISDSLNPFVFRAFLELTAESKFPPNRSQSLCFQGISGTITLWIILIRIWSQSLCFQGISGTGNAMKIVRRTSLSIPLFSGHFWNRQAHEKAIESTACKRRSGKLS
jgi:hypothetical protein